MSSKAERTKAYIIEKTSPIFNQKGVAGTSLADITEATGLTKGAIYGNFSDKDAVAIAAFNYNVEQIFNELAAFMAQQPTYVGKLKAITHYYRARYATGRLGYGCPMANTATEADDTHPLLHAQVKERYIKWRKGIVRLVQAGIEAGELNTNIDAAKIANIMIATIQGCIVVTKATGDGQFALAALGHLDDMIDQYSK